MYAAPLAIALISLITRIAVPAHMMVIGDMNLEGGLGRAHRPSGEDFESALDNDKTLLIVPQSCDDLYKSVPENKRMGVEVR